MENRTIKTSLKNFVKWLMFEVFRFFCSFLISAFALELMKHNQVDPFKQGVYYAITFFVCLELFYFINKQLKNMN